MSRFQPFPFNTVRTWRSGTVVKSTEGWAPLYRYARVGRSELHDSIGQLRSYIEGVAPSKYPLSPEDERRRKRLQQFWTKLTPNPQNWPIR